MMHYLYLRCIIHSQRNKLLYNDRMYSTVQDPWVVMAGFGSDAWIVLINLLTTLRLFLLLSYRAPVPATRSITGYITPCSRCINDLPSLCQSWFLFIYLFFIRDLFLIFFFPFPSWHPRGVPHLVLDLVLESESTETLSVIFPLYFK